MEKINQIRNMISRYLKVNHLGLLINERREDKDKIVQLYARKNENKLLKIEISFVDI